MDNTSHDVKDAAGRVEEFRQQVGTQVEEASKKMRSDIKTMDFTEATIPDVFKGVPKLISPGVHAWLDIAVTGYFLALGTWFAARGKARPAVASFINAGVVAGVSALTDYDGSGKKPISFKLHGTLDALQSATAAVAPVLYGFAGEPETAFFYGQAANEVAVIAATDWDEGMPAKNARKAA